MSTFINSDITNGGRILIAKNYLGQRMNFTRIVMGDGYLPPDTAPRDMTDVVNAVVNVNISKMRINADSTVIIGGVFTNADISEPFFYRELALFAEDEEGVEVLYCYGNAGDFAERITPVGGSSVIEKSIDIVTAIGTTDNVTATIVRTTTADDISYNDTVSQLGAGSLQEAVEILARKTTDQITTIVISETEPETPCEVWLKPTGQAEITPGTPENPDDPEEPEPTPQTLYYYLAHYYDKEQEAFIPFMYTNAAQNILMNLNGPETVADAIAQLQSGRVYTLAELYAHTGNEDLHTSPGQLDNIFTALGELVLHVEDLDIHFKPGERAKWDNAATVAGQALSAANAANEGLEDFDARIATLEDSVFSNITANPFSILFNDTQGINLVKGIWNREGQRIEC